MNSTASQALQPQKFVQTLRDILSDPTAQPYMHWSEDGTCVVVENERDVSDHILPRYFRHEKFCSFVRQLNNYGFKKEVGLDKNGRLVFKNELFQSTAPELSSQITSRKTQKRYVGDTEGGDAVIGLIKKEKGTAGLGGVTQFSEVEHLRSANVRLFQAILELKTKVESLESSVLQRVDNLEARLASLEQGRYHPPAPPAFIDHQHLSFAHAPAGVLRDSLVGGLVDGGSGGLGDLEQVLSSPYPTDLSSPYDSAGNPYSPEGVVEGGHADGGGASGKSGVYGGGGQADGAYGGGQTDESYGGGQAYGQSGLD
eukprot:CAMPEP_0177664818 /NCGR_PEP_ID=MMETSP0447-20121125/20716_1 /TAXON_ID=0 /ORGANISM="Stygamoeba regulata, Strain BSH-02190019" /LENGTH=312 /DNA_ID=CAMNT_0019170855 /DNA_START=245 /DNA_END=1180 /DNA_ORIENTATION=-